MDKVDLGDFEDAVMNSGISGEFYGEYSGRGFHQGYAVSVDDMAQLIGLGAALFDNDCQELTDYPPHIDNLGTGYIVSWDKRLFNA